MFLLFLTYINFIEIEKSFHLINFLKVKSLPRNSIFVFEVTNIDRGKNSYQNNDLFFFYFNILTRFFSFPRSTDNIVDFNYTTNVKLTILTVFFLYSFTLT